MINNIETTIQNFEILPNNIAKYVLRKNMMEKNPPRKTAVIVAGPNGSGKSTFVANMFRNGFFSNLQYVNADLFADEYFSYEKDNNKRAIEAMNFTTETCHSLIEDGYSFVYETVLSHPSKLDIVSKLLENNYDVTVVFIMTNNPEINVQRVKKRVSEGGHPVPVDKIISRYPRSLENGKLLTDMVENSVIIDNSYAMPVILLSIPNSEQTEGAGK